MSISPRWEVSYAPAANGKTVQSTAVLVDGQSLLVAVIAPGVNPANPTLRMGNRVFPAQVVGYDPVSRLGFYKVEGATTPKPTIWLNEVGGKVSASLLVLTPSGPLKCRSTGWVKQVGGKILPLALLRVNFDKEIPPAGSPLTDEEGKVVAIVFQPADGGTTAYAIPAEAVHRVRRDVCESGRLVRGWLGLSLRAENQSPQIVRVLAGSPAAAAGIQPSDVLLNVDTRQISNYADAANAFFYLIPGEPVKVRLLRGVEQLEFNLTPTRPTE